MIAQFYQLGGLMMVVTFFVVFQRGISGWFDWWVVAWFAIGNDLDEPLCRYDFCRIGGEIGAGAKIEKGRKVSHAPHSLEI